MKKAIGFIFTVFTVVLLGACSTDVHEDLQSQQWNVVATNGESYTADFASDTVRFNLGGLSTGFSYEIEDDVITMYEEDNENQEPLVYEIEQNGNEYVFTTEDEDTRDQYGNMTLSPTE